MKIVIDIPEEEYKNIITYNSFRWLRNNVIEAINKATPLPKGHGRIGDLDELEKVLDEYVLNEKGCPMHIASEICYNIDCFEAIIGADREETEE